MINNLLTRYEFYSRLCFSPRGPTAGVGPLFGKDNELPGVAQTILG
jgi:hypothetical protein